MNRINEFLQQDIFGKFPYEDSVRMMKAAVE